MELITRIDSDIKKAMLSRDQARLNGLRNIKAALLLARTEEGAGGTISPETELKVLHKMAKQRKESAGIYKSQGRSDLERTELEELDVVESYLPRQMDAGELEAELKKIIEATGATSIKDMGRVMGQASQQLAGKADGRTISEAVKRLLS
ncbi:MAG TPA: GatB/YqeY domain-containing protein [Anseongella sp.]|nr:GatB/YqeY domain-containing protein [Anseongella sp.]